MKGTYIFLADGFEEIEARDSGTPERLGSRRGNPLKHDDLNRCQAMRLQHIHLLKITFGVLSENGYFCSHVSKP